METIYELICLAQKLDELGLIKEADLLDDIAEKMIIKNAHDDIDLELLAQSLRKYLDEGLSLEEAMNKAVSDFEELELEGASFEASPAEKAKAKSYVPLQISEMFSPVSE